jgi:hypothetical protein
VYKTVVLELLVRLLVGYYCIVGTRSTSISNHVYVTNKIRFDLIYSGLNALSFVCAWVCVWVGRRVGGDFRESLESRKHRP